MNKKKLNEDLEKFRSLLGYDPSKGITEAKMRRPAPGYLTEEEPENEGDEETDTEEEGGFDFGDEETSASDFDFGDEGSPEDEETVEDEFGTADEFSAADELDTTEDDVEEIDVTSIVTKSDEAKQMAQQAVNVGQENMSYLKSLTDKLSNLESQLSKMDTIASKLGKLESEIKTPEEKLELRSLDSFPFNMKLSDYWEDKASKDSRYKIYSGTEEENEKEYRLTKDELNSDYNEQDIKNSFNP